MKKSNKYLLGLLALGLLFGFELNASKPKHIVPEAMNMDILVKPGERRKIIRLQTKYNPNNGKLRYKFIKRTRIGYTSQRITNRNQVRYYPKRNFTGIDYLTYKVKNKYGIYSKPATIKFIVNNPPQTSPTIDKQLSVNKSIQFALNGKDLDGHSLTYTVTKFGAPKHGRFEIVNKILRYTPDKDYIGKDTITYVAHDGISYSNRGKIYFKVIKNEEPIVSDMDVNVSINNSISISLEGNDVNNDTLTYRIITAPVNGIATITENNLVYTPHKNINSMDTLTYVANDGNLNSNIGTINFTMVNVKPIVQSFEVSVPIYSSSHIKPQGFDENGDKLTYLISTPPNNGQITINHNNMINYISDKVESTETFTYIAHDSSNNYSDEATVTIRIAHDSPVLTQNYYPNNFYIINKHKTIELLSNRTGELAITDECGVLSPSYIEANIETNVTIITPDIGNYYNCYATLKDSDGVGLSTIPLDSFSILNLLPTKLIQGRNDGKGVDLVFIGDGFQENELDIFENLIIEYVRYLIESEEVTKLQENALNIHTINIASKDSGVSTDDVKLESALGSRIIYPNIRFSSRIINFLAAEEVPQFDKIYVLLNNREILQGATATNIMLSTIGRAYGERVLRHELGHGLAGLGDEYTFGGSSSRPIPSSFNYPNLSVHNDRETIKWKHWLDDLSENDNVVHVDIFEGGFYRKTEVWRPTYLSFMRNSLLERNGFSPVHSEAWALGMYKIAGTFYSKMPESNLITQNIGENTIFSVELSMGTQMQEIKWKVNEVIQNTDSNITTFTYGAEESENYIVEAIISDKSELIRVDDLNYSSDSIIWNVTIE